MVCLMAMQGLGKPGVNMGNMAGGAPVDLRFYFPGYAEGGMSGDLEGTASGSSYVPADAPIAYREYGHAEDTQAEDP